MKSATGALLKYDRSQIESDTSYEPCPPPLCSRGSTISMAHGYQGVRRENRLQGKLQPSKDEGLQNRLA